jgi:hypothetical protein
MSICSALMRGATLSRSLTMGKRLAIAAALTFGRSGRASGADVSILGPHDSCARSGRTRRPRGSERQPDPPRPHASGPSCRPGRSLQWTRPHDRFASARYRDWANPPGNSEP